MQSYLPVCLVLIVLGRYWANRGPIPLTTEDNTREPCRSERALTWAGGLLSVLVGAELYLNRGDYLTAREAYWLNLLPLSWLVLTLLRRDIPGDRTATNIGLWTLTPYAAYAVSQKETPESTWLSLCLFGWAFFIGVWRDMQRPG
jgi:hypothetical protein